MNHSAGSTTQLQVEIFDVEGYEHRAVLRLSGEVDLATTQRLVTAFREVADRQLTEVIVDASRVTFLDSAGVHALTQGKAIVQAVGSRIVLLTSPQVRRVLDLVSPEPVHASRVDTMEKARKAVGWPSDDSGSVMVVDPVSSETWFPDRSGPTAPEPTLAARLIDPPGTTARTPTGIRPYIDGPAFEFNSVRQGAA